MWKPDTELLEQSRDMLREALTALAGAPGDEEREEEAAILLEAAGTLVGLGAEEETRRLVADATDARAACEAYLGRLDLTELEEAASSMSGQARRLMLLDLDESLELAHSVNEALERRDRLELLRMGAELISPRYVFDAEQESAWLFFDELVGEDQWRLLSLGDMRWVPAAWMKPESRARFPWRTRGYGMGREALDALTDAAEVLAHFPEARAHFEALIQTIKPQGQKAQGNETQSNEAQSEPVSGEGPVSEERAQAHAADAIVIDLSVCRERLRADESGRMRVAAADESSAGDVDLPGVEGLTDLTLESGALIAYLTAEDAGVPRLEWMNGSVTGTLLPDTEAAYRMPLPDAEEVTLVVPVSGTDRRIVLRDERATRDAED